MENNNSESFDWGTVIHETYRDLTQQVIERTPQIFGAILLMLAGWLTAYLLKVLTKKIIQGLNSLFAKVAGHDGAKRERIKKFYTQFLGGLVFWVVLICFASASTNMLGWILFSSWIESLVGFLPHLLSGLLIILAGYLIGNAARSSIVRAQLSSNADRAETFASIAQAAILIAGIVIGVEQIGLNVSFLTNVTVVVIGILLAGAAGAFSLGARNMMANIIGARHTKKHCAIGEQMTLDGHKGEVLEITQTSIVLDTVNGRAVIPAKLFQEHSSIIGSPEMEAKPKETATVENGDKGNE